MNYKIAVLEDNELIQNMLKINLEKYDFQVSCFSDSETLIEQTQHTPFDLFILDIFLPGMSGMEALEILRSERIHQNTPVLMLTVQQQLQSKINALNSGADDYLVKPFNMEELLARVNALIRRSHGNRSLPSNRLMLVNGFKIDLSTRECESNKGKVVLSEKEITLLEYFSKRPGQTLLRADILEEVWGMDVSPTPRTIDNFILKFRKLFETNPENPQHFLSVRNKGYRFEV
ncbi:MAG: response regulator transcription factor [Candidatus Omnitrophota bacterium]